MECKLSQELLSITLDGQPVQVEPGADGFKLFTEKTTVAQRVNGELKDLAHKVADGDVVEAVAISSPDGLNILRHSTAHVLAQAVQNINPEAKLGIGPPSVDGFYYDVDGDNYVAPSDARVLINFLNRLNNNSGAGEGEGGEG